MVINTSNPKQNLRKMKSGQMNYHQENSMFIQQYLSIQLRKVIKHITHKKFCMSANILLKTKGE